MKQTLKSFLFLSIFVLASAAFTDVAHAGRYELIKGKGVEVCEAYQKNLNSFKPQEPMICVREINPEMKDFKKPDWVEPDLAQARALEFDMAKMTSRVLNRPEPRDESKIKVFTAKDSGWPMWRWIAKVDIDNDGVPDMLLKKQEGDCMSHAFSVNIAVLAKDGKHYNLEASQYIDADFSALVGQLNKDPKPWNRRTAGIAKSDFSGYSLYDVFLYKGVTYFDLWEINKERLHVFLRRNNKTREICTYRFR